MKGDAPPRPELTRVLVEQASAHRFANLPDDVCLLAKQCILDWFAVTIAGLREPAVRLLLVEIEEDGGNPQATLIGQMRKASAVQAALFNGTAAHALDYDDVNLAISGHPTAAILPGLLALAEARGGSGKDVLTAFVAGYEVACRTGLLVAPDHYERGFHATATVGSLGSAAACAHLLKLNPQKTAWAYGLAATLAGGLKAMFGTMAKPLHAGLAARNGLVAAKLAARGFDSSENVLENRQGFANAHSSDFNPEAALAEPPRGFHIRSNLFKYHASCYGTHAVLECTRQLREAHQLQLADVHKIVLSVNRANDKICNIAEPRNGMEAKFSLRLNAAFGLTAVDTARLDAYEDRAVSQKAIVALRDKVQVELLTDWPPMKAAVRVEMADGRVFEISYDAGVPADNVVAQGQRLETKFSALVEPVLGRKRAGLLAAAIINFETLSSMGEIARLSHTA